MSSRPKAVALDVEPIFAHPKRVPANRSVCVPPLVSREPSPDRSNSPLSFSTSKDPNVAVGQGNNAAQARRPADLASPGKSLLAWRWFDDSNKNVLDDGKKNFFKDDPPFFLKQKSADLSTGTPHPAFASPDIVQGPSSPSLHSRPNSPYNDRLDDFRSVIDDLTIENRELHRKIDRMQRLRRPLTQHNFQLEVHVNDMPASKKRRLERALREVVMTTLEPLEPLSSLPTGCDSVTDISRNMCTLSKPSSSSTSIARPVDSAYASMSASGAATAFPSRQETTGSGIQSMKGLGPPPASQPNNKPTLSTGTAPVLPPMAKQQHVVRKLEQLFTGKENRSPEHIHLRRQQDVHRPNICPVTKPSVAGRQPTSLEGVREAKMSIPSPGGIARLRPPTPSPNLSDECSSRDNSGRSNETPGQRPTRPLDLDPSRAQNPTDNIRYMKHLGFGSPKMDPDKDFGEGEGWVYLNLLMNMAQLHTAHVTPDFVRTAVKEVSTRFELSPDGRSIRWKGGQEGTQMANGNVDSIEKSDDSPPSEVAIARQTSRAKVSKGFAAVGLEADLPNGNGKTSGTQDADSGFSSMDSHSSNRDAKPGGASSCYRTAFESHRSPYAHGGSASRQFRLADMDDCTNLDPGNEERLNGLERPIAGEAMGPIIFYQTAKFFTDLSCDADISPADDQVGARSSLHILGATNDSFGTMTEIADGKGPLSAGIVTGDYDPSFSTEVPLAGPMDWPSSTHTETGLPRSIVPPFQLEASGLGGVRPDENFTLDVLTEHSASPGPGKSTYHLSIHRRQHPPASLPPPSYAFLPYSSTCSGSTISEEQKEDDEWLSESCNEQRHSNWAVPPSLFRFLSSFSTGSAPHGIERGLAAS